MQHRPPHISTCRNPEVYPNELHNKVTASSRALKPLIEIMSKILSWIFHMLLLIHSLQAQDEIDDKSEPEFAAVLESGVVRLSPFNAADRNWDEDEPIPWREIAGSNTESRVIGGHFTNISQTPYYVLISRDDLPQWCGGTIYNEETIITAAHCFFIKKQRFDLSRLNITAGESDLRGGDGTEQRRKLEKVIIHPKYKPKAVFFDVALVYLSEPLKFNEYVAPMAISRPGPGVVHKGMVIVSGFGYTKQRWNHELFEMPYFTNQLKYAHATVIPTEECCDIFRKLQYKKVVKILTHEKKYALMCAMGQEKEGISDDACQSDSGGPAVCSDESHEPYLCGIVATGIGCGQVGFPGIYTDVSAVSQWIHENCAGRSALESSTKSNQLQLDNDEQPKNNKANSARSNLLGLCNLLCLVFGVYIFGKEGHLGKPILLLLQILFLGQNSLAQSETKSKPEPVFLAVLGNGQVHWAPFNPADRNWKDEKPISVNAIEVPKGLDVRIIGGHFAEENQIPYLVLLSNNRQPQWCGGTIFNQFTIITAAHCFYESRMRFDVSRMEITAGETNLGASTGTEQSRKVGNVIIHPRYDPSNSFFDVAVIHLSKQLEFNEHVDAMVIAEPGMAHNGTLLVSGFGYTMKKKPHEGLNQRFYAQELKFAHAEIVMDKCLDIYQNLELIAIISTLAHPDAHTLMCAIGAEKGGATDDACQGDSGGPAVCQDKNGQPYLCGIVATGIGCGLSGFPGVYTDVSVMSEWIQENAATRATRTAAAAGILTLNPFLVFNLLVLVQANHFATSFCRNSSRQN